MTEEPTYTFNGDGSIDIPVEGKPVRFVKEADLLTVKRGSESKAKEWDNEKSQLQTQLAEANRLREETHQSLLSEQAAHEQLKSTTSDYDTHKTRVGELEAELGSVKESVGNYEKELTNRIRHTLINIHGAKEDALKDKTLDQLRNLEEAATIFGNNKIRTPARYDGGPGGPGGGTVPEKPIDRARRIIEEREAKAGSAQVSNAAILSKEGR